MAIADDFSVAINGDIRRVGTGSTTYTVLAFRRYLGALADDAQAAGDDLYDITTDTAAERVTDNILTLNSPFNVDDTVARFLYDGSITQDDGATVYSGLEVVGSVVSGTEIMIIQDDKVLPPYWGTGLNPDVPNNVIMRILVKTRSGDADIDKTRITTRCNELGDQFKEFPVTLGLGVSTSALSTLDDLNNNKTDSTLEGFTTVVLTEGFQDIDIDGDTVTEEYYGQWTKGTQTLNDTYEASKQRQQRAHVVLSGTDTGTDYVVDNATIVGQAQSFTSRAVAEKLVEARFRLKIGAGTPTGPLTAELYATTAGVIPTGAALATSEPVLASQIHANYAETLFRFYDNFTMVASTQYAIVIRHPNGGASDRFAVEGAAAGTVSGENKAEENPAATWTAQAAADLWFSVTGSPVLHGRAGELMRGIDFEVVYDTEAGGPFTENEALFWATQVTYDNIASGPFVVGNYCNFQPSGGGTVKNGGKILKQTAAVLWVALENITGNLLDNDIITSGATTADLNVTIVDQDKNGGEGVLLALDDNGVAGDFYIQLISGGAPVDNLPIEGRTSGATALVNATVTARPISPEFLGATTGTNLIGAYGVGFEPADVGSSDKFFDLTNTLRTPPNNVTFTVTGLVSGEDRILAGPRTGSALNKSFLTLNTTLSGAAETAVVCTASIPTDTPQDGTGANPRLRVQLDTGIYRRIPYVS